MNEYLFYQENKRNLPKDLPDTHSYYDGASTNSSMLSNSRSMSHTFLEQPSRKLVARGSSHLIPPSSSALDKRPVMSEFSDETLNQKYSSISQGYEQQYINAGFPPKICASMISKLCPQYRLKTKILDIGCGKGDVGKYLKELGFHHVDGLDCVGNVLEQAKKQNAYDLLEHCTFGVNAPEHLQGEYNYVAAASLINNFGHDISVFRNLLDCLKVGGYAIFATKLDMKGKDYYESQIKQLEADGYWSFTSEHCFNRYDKLAGNKGKFSHKKVKILCYQKIDHEQWLIEQEQAKIRAIEEQKQLEKMQAELEAEQRKNQKKKPAKFLD